MIVAARATRPEAALAFQRLLESVSTEDELIARLCSDAQRLLLERAAVPRNFTRRLADAVLLRDLHGTDATWEWLIAHIDVEPVRTAPGEYRLHDSVRDARREELLSAMRSDVWRWARFVEESAHIANALDERDPRQASEKIHHLAIAAPGECARLLATEFDAANAHNDFGRCEHLLATVDSQLRFIEAIRTHPSTSDLGRRAAAALQETLDDRERLFTARRRFADERRRAAHTLARSFMKDEVPLVSAASDQWIVNVESEGGRGKTAFMNWLIVDHLVPSRFPVAKVDFDNPRWSSRQYAPWEFLLHIAMELDVQLRGAPLTSIIGEIRDGQGSDESQSASQARRRGDARNVELESDLATDIPSRLGRAIAEATTAPVVIILDTLEELRLRNLASLADVVDAIAAVQRNCPNLRLYLSGRFNLAERHGDMWARFAGVVRPVAIPEFSETEAIDFLTQVRQFDDRDLAAAIASKANRRPFQLALAADLVQSRGGLTREQVDSLGDLDLHYLVDRVLRRIEDPRVRWLVRYGVVPRVLTLDFVKKVMLPVLRAAMAGSKAHDDPDLDPAELRRDGVQFQAVLESPDAPLDIGQVWAMLQAYASRCSFVAASGDDSDALVFHADVRHPMRRVLQEHAARYADSAYARLHTRARDTALDEAALASGSDHSAWGDATSRALYHSFQLSRDLGEQCWRQARETMERAEISDEACERVASSLALPEYVDDAGLPLLRGDGSPVIGVATLMQARLESARRAAALARRARDEGRPASTWWERATESLDAFDRLVSSRPREARRSREAGTGASTALALLRVDVAMNSATPSTDKERRARIRTSRTLLERAKRATRDADERLQLDVALARLEPPERVQSAIDRLHPAIAGTVVGLTPATRSEAVVLLGDLAQRALRIDVALEAAREHVRLTGGSDAVTRALALVRQANARWLARDAAGAIEGCLESKLALGPAPIARGALSVLEWALQLQGEAQLWRRDLAAIDRLVGEVRGVVIRRTMGLLAPADSDTEAITTLASFIPLVTALRDIVALRVADVPESLERARARYEELGDHERLMFLVLSELKYCFREMEDLRAAESQALRVGRTRADDADTSTIRARVLAYEVFMARGLHEAAAEHLRALMGMVRVMDPRSRLLVHMRALAWGEPRYQRSALIARVVEALEEITPAALRVRLLADQLQPREELTLTAAERRSIERAIGGARALDGWSLDDPTPDAILHAVDLARVAIALGRLERAGPVLDALAACTRERERLPFVTMVQALELDAARLGYVPRSLAPAGTVRQWRSALGGGLGHVVAFVQEGALHQLTGDDAEAAAFARLAVQAPAPKGRPPTAWDAMANELLLVTSSRPAERERARNAAIAFHSSRQDQQALQRLAVERPADDATTAHPPATHRAPHLDTRLVTLVQVIGRSKRTTSSKGLQLAFGTPSRLVSRQLPRADATWRALQQDVLQRSSLGVPQQALARLLDAWEPFCTSLGDAIFPPIEHRMKRGDTSPAFDLELQIDPDAAILQGVPWELARGTPPSNPAGLVPKGEGSRRFVGELAPNVLLTRAPVAEASAYPASHVRWVQRMVQALTSRRFVVDGIFGNATRAALAQLLSIDAPSLSPDTSRRLIQRFARSRGVERPRLFLMAGDSTLSLRRGTRTRAIDTLSSGPVYVFEGIETTVFDARSTGDAMTALRGGDFDVVVLTGSYRTDTRRGGVVFDFVQHARRGATERASGLDAPLLCKFLERPDRPNSPIVIVDAQVAGSPSERLRALMLRNIFCAELAAKSNVAAVIGTGLDNEFSLGPTLIQLLEELRTGHSVANVIHRFRSMGADTRGASPPSSPGDAARLHAVLPSRALALWSGFPHDVFLAGAAEPPAP